MKSINRSALSVKSPVDTLKLPRLKHEGFCCRQGYRVPAERVGQAGSVENSGGARPSCLSGAIGSQMAVSGSEAEAAPAEKMARTATRAAGDYHRCANCGNQSLLALNISSTMSLISARLKTAEVNGSKHTA